MKKILTISIFILSIFLNFSSNALSIETHPFDKIITKEFIASLSKKTVPFQLELKDSENPKGREYITTFDVGDGNHLMIHILVVKGGVLVNQKKLKQAKQKFKNWYFAKLGRGGWMESLGFGPGGTGLATTFGTNDGRFDIVIIKSNLTGEVDPELSNDIPQKISNLYNNTKSQ